jgi:deoxyadenosine kinase
MSAQQQPLHEKFIGIAGLIGAGKSTLATALGKHLEMPVYYEPVADNAYLADFYQDPARYGFQMQIYLLNRRFQQHQEIIWRGQGGVQDRTIYEDAIFAKTLMQQGMIDQRDYETYLELFKHMSHFMCRPSLIIYLDLTPERSLERIKMRARNVEAGIPMAYLELLHRGYEEFIADISRSIPVIRVPWEEFHETEEVVKLVQETYLKESFLREVHWRPSKA